MTGVEVPEIPPETDWMKQAACKGAGFKMFFAWNTDDVGRAKAFCAVCPVRNECLEFAEEFAPNDGIWGGYTEKERRLIRQGLPLLPPRECEGCGMGFVPFEDKFRYHSRTCYKEAVLYKQTKFGGLGRTLSD